MNLSGKKNSFPPGAVALSCALFLILACSNPFVYSEEIVIDDYGQGLHSSWKEKIFKGKTAYEVVQGEDSLVVKAESRASASALYREVDYDIEQFPVLAWRWKIDHVLSEGDGRKKEEDDFAARIYVVFPALFFWNTKTINYVWANRLPVGKIFESPYASNSVVIVVESGNEKAGQWAAERRNVLDDYRQCFKEDPPKVRGIAIMTDTDNTEESTTAWFGPIRISSMPPDSKKEP